MTFSDGAEVRAEEGSQFWHHAPRQDAVHPRPGVTGPVWGTVRRRAPPASPACLVTRHVSRSRWQCLATQQVPPPFWHFFWPLPEGCVSRATSGTLSCRCCCCCCTTFAMTRFTFLLPWETLRIDDNHHHLAFSVSVSSQNCTRTSEQNTCWHSDSPLSARVLSVQCWLI